MNESSPTVHIEKHKDSRGIEFYTLHVHYPSGAIALVANMGTPAELFGV